jgi:hypothetical protein
MAHINSTHPVCPSLDTTRSGIARVRDAALGGKDNYAIDRDLVSALEHAAPGFSDLVRAERAWHIRAVRYLASIGVDQFLDCGVGLPVPFDNTHEVAQRYNSEARVVYADADCIVVAHGRALLQDDERSLVVQADYTYPEELLPAAGAFLWTSPARSACCSPTPCTTSTTTPTPTNSWTPTVTRSHPVPPSS